MFTPDATTKLRKGGRAMARPRARAATSAAAPHRCTPLGGRAAVNGASTLGTGGASRRPAERSCDVARQPLQQAGEFPVAVLLVPTEAVEAPSGPRAQHRDHSPQNKRQQDHHLAPPRLPNWRHARACDSRFVALNSFRYSMNRVATAAERSG